jgi:hypothetical protein
MRGEGTKENDGRGEFNYIVSTFPNITTYLQCNKNTIIKNKIKKRKQV